MLRKALPVISTTSLLNLLSYIPQTWKPTQCYTCTKTRKRSNKPCKLQANLTNSVTKVYNISSHLFNMASGRARSINEPLTITNNLNMGRYTSALFMDIERALEELSLTSSPFTSLNLSCLSTISTFRSTRWNTSGLLTSSLPTYPFQQRTRYNVCRWHCYLDLTKSMRIILQLKLQD